MHGQPAPPHIAVSRSVRARGETKTPKSRRTLALPAMCVEALSRERELQDADRRAAGARWQETGLVFTSALGTAMDAANVRRSFRRPTSREITSIGTSASDSSETNECRISRGVHSCGSIPGTSARAHRGTSVTEVVYRKQVRPVIQTGALAMDLRFGGRCVAVVGHFVGHPIPALLRSQAGYASD